MSVHVSLHVPVGRGVRSRIHAHVYDTCLNTHVEAYLDRAKLVGAAFARIAVQLHLSLKTFDLRAVVVSLTPTIVLDDTALVMIKKNGAGAVATLALQTLDLRADVCPGGLCTDVRRHVRKSGEGLDLLRLGHHPLRQLLRSLVVHVLLRRHLGLERLCLSDLLRDHMPLHHRQSLQSFLQPAPCYYP